MKHTNPTSLTRRGLGGLAAGLGVALALSACGGGTPLDSPSTSAGTGSADSGAPLVVGSADFPESQVIGEIYAGALNSKETKRIIATIGQPLFFPPDRLLFLRGSALVAQRFDLTRMELVGNPVEGPPRCELTTISGSSVITASPSASVLSAIPGPEDDVIPSWPA